MSDETSDEMAGFQTWLLMDAGCFYPHFIFTILFLITPELCYN